MKIVILTTETFEICDFDEIFVNTTQKKKLYAMQYNYKYLI